MKLLISPSLSPLPFCLFPPVPYIRLAILSYLRFGLRGADNIAVTIEKSAMRPQAVMARADYLRDGPNFPIEQKRLDRAVFASVGAFYMQKNLNSLANLIIPKMI